MKLSQTFLAILLCAFAALVVPGTASAQSNDPSAGSPSGTIYELPLDNARKDAAPRHSGGSGGSASGGSSSGGSASPIRSENGFGSSSTVPGTGGTAAASSQNPASAQSSGSSGSGSGSGKGGSGKGGSGSGSSKDGKSGAGGKRKTPIGESQVPPSAVVREAAAGGSPSLWRSALLLGLGVLVAAGLAAAAHLAARRR